MIDDIDDLDEGQEVVEISTGYAPRPLQSEIHQRIARFSVLAIHRRFGKTVLSINQGIHVGLNCPLPNPHISFISPLYKQSKTVAWDYLKEFTRNIPGAKAYESELRVDIPRGPNDVMRFQLFGADNPDSLRGMYHDYAIFDEYGNQPPSIWFEVVSPALADRLGGALFLGTPNGKNHFYKIYTEAMKKYEGGDDEWFAATYRADESGVIPEKELAAQRDNMPESDYRQEFLCDWAAAVKGAYYAHELTRAREEGRIMRVPYQPELPVHCAFDLGLDDFTAIWFIQCFRHQVWLLAYEEYQNMEDGLVGVMKQLRQKPYVYGDMFMPWDIKIRELTTAKSRLEVVEDLGFSVVVSPKISLDEGIDASRRLISRCYFDEKLCHDGVDRLENYRKKWDNKRHEFMNKPEHDDNSHGCDAFRSFAVCYDPGLGDKLNNTMGSSLMQQANHIPKSSRSC